MKKLRKCKTLYNASIYRGDLYFEDVRQCHLGDELAHEIIEDKHLKAIRVLSLSENWEALVYLSFDVSVREAINLQMTLRKEKRSTKSYWYAYRKVFGVLHKRYVGLSEEVTEARLLEIAQKLPG